MVLESGVEIRDLDCHSSQPAQRVERLRVDLEHFLVNPLGFGTVAESGVAEGEIRLRLGPLRTVAEAAFEGLGGGAEIFALQAEVTQTETGFLFLRRLLEDGLVPPLRLVDLTGVLQQERDIPDRREGIWVGLNGMVVSRAGALDVAEMFADDPQVGM